MTPRTHTVHVWIAIYILQDRSMSRINLSISKSIAKFSQCHTTNFLVRVSYLQTETQIFSQKKSFHFRKLYLFRQQILLNSTRKGPF